MNTEWAQVEVIELINDGTGLGFGIIGGRSTGVVVKTILPGGVADRDGRLQSGDHILQIGEVNLLGMGSEQVAAVLRQCGSCVRLVVARPIEPTSPDAFTSSAPIVPTRILGDPEELERHLLQANGYGNHLEGGSLAGSESGQFKGTIGDDLLGMAASSTFDSLPEVELVEVELKKDSHGLGITIAGYVCEKGGWMDGIDLYFFFVLPREKVVVLVTSNFLCIRLKKVGGCRIPFIFSGLTG